MITAVVEGIARAIYDAFSAGGEPTIYTEAVEQGLKEPCFFITCLSPARKKGLDTIYTHSMPFVVQYVPRRKSDSNAECNKACEKLFPALEYITVDGVLIRGNDMHGEINDGVLSFFANYVFNTYSKKDIYLMESHKTETQIKHQ